MLLVRFLQAVIGLCLLGIILVVFQSGATSARQGVFIRDYVSYNSSQVLNVEKPETARTFYGELKGLGKPTLFSLKANKGFLVQARVLIPNLEELDDYRPALALFGPGLPKPTTDQLDHLPFTVPAEQGLALSEVIIKPGVTPALLPQYTEPYTQSNYWEGQELLRELPQDGTYYLVVFSRIGQGGKYALELGDTAATGLKEILGFPVLWSRVHLWFGDWSTAVLAWLALSMLVVYGLYSLAKALFIRNNKFQAGSEAHHEDSPSLATLADAPTFIERVSKYQPAPKARRQNSTESDKAKEI